MNNASSDALEKDQFEPNDVIVNFNKESFLRFNF